MALGIRPEDLPVIAAQLGVTEAALSSMVSAWAAVAAPIPAAADDVSRWACVEVAGHSVNCASHIVPGLTELTKGAEALIPVSINYQGTDLTGGSVVSTHIANFTR